jgi:hypothetical protein
MVVPPEPRSGQRARMLIIAATLVLATVLGAMAVNAGTPKQAPLAL